MRTYWILGLLVLFAGATAQATQFEAFDRSDQIREADVILTGHVLSNRSAWSEDRSVIHTDAEVRVDEVWKGLPDSDRVTVRVLGGTVDGMALEVEGSPRLETGENVLLFLRREGDVYRPSGMAYGKFALESAGGETFALGSLTPDRDGPPEFEAVSYSIDDIREEVTAELGW